VADHTGNCLSRICLGSGQYVVDIAIRPMVISFLCAMDKIFGILGDSSYSDNCAPALRCHLRNVFMYCYFTSSAITLMPIDQGEVGRLTRVLK
jgi:hypothetical protein